LPKPVAEPEPLLSPRTSEDPVVKKKLQDLQKRVDELETKMAAETLEKEVLTTYKSQLETKLKEKDDTIANLTEEKGTPSVQRFPIVLKGF